MTADVVLRCRLPRYSTCSASGVVTQHWVISNRWST